MGAFGEKLRKQREQRGLALEAISNTTKISTRMLRALEDEHFDQLPGGVFNKGFVRAYARQVGLDEEETVTDYLTALRESQVQSQNILPDFRSSGGSPSPASPADSRHHVLPADAHPPGGDNKRYNFPAAERRRTDERRNEVRRHRDRDPQENAPLPAEPAKRVRHETPSAHNSIPAAQPQFETHHNNNGEDQRYASSSLPGFITSTPETDSSGESAQPGAFSLRISKPTMLAAALLLLAVVGLAIWNSKRHRDNAVEAHVATKPAETPNPPVSSVPAPARAVSSASASSPKSEAASTPAKSPAAKNSANLPAPSTNLSTPDPAPKLASDSDAIASFAVKTTPIPEAKQVPTFTLRIRADQTTWISIIADGKPETHETLIAPAHTSVRASHDVTVKVGNAAGVSFQWNGKEFPAQGNAGEVRSYVFDATGMRPGSQPESPAANH